MYFANLGENNVRETIVQLVIWYRLLGKKRKETSENTVVKMLHKKVDKKLCYKLLIWYQWVW